MKRIIELLLGFCFGLGVGVSAETLKNRDKDDKFVAEKNRSKKHLDLFETSIQWVMNLQNGKRIEEYLGKKGYKSIAIYGMGKMGEALYSELKNSRITVKYCIDKNAEDIYGDYKIFSPDDDLDMVDAVVITAVSFFGEISESLSKKMDCEMVSLEDIVYDM